MLLWFSHVQLSKGVKGSPPSLSSIMSQLADAAIVAAGIAIEDLSCKLVKFEWRDMEGFGGSGCSRNRRIMMASSTGRGGSRLPPLCGGRRRVVATKKHRWSNPLSVNNNVKKLQRRDISSKPNRASAITKSLHRFLNFRLTIVSFPSYLLFFFSSL